MDDFFNVGDDDNNATQQTGDAAVVVNQTASDDFAFMQEQENPVDSTQSQQQQNDDVVDDKPNTDDNVDPFASMIDNDNNESNNLMGDDDGKMDESKADEIPSNDNKDQNDEPTFLSVWQEQRKVEMQKRKEKEAEIQKTLNEEGQASIEKFHSDRVSRIEAKKKENREKEKDLREDLESVFKHGTTWEQVGKMVNLNEKMESLQNFDKDRMRDVLIHLRN
eukprot:195649_1